MDRPSPRSAGLTGAEAKRRLEAEGPNALPSRRASGLLALLAGVLREPMFALLIGAATVYLILGDLREALVLAASMVAVVAITVIQQRRTERALQALRDLSSPRALVVRDGVEQRIAGVDVVRGDLMLLREGDRVPADAVLLEAHGLAVDESLLTGESVPVDKRAQAAAQAEAHVMSGTLVVRGTGRAEVVATGARSQLGRIGESLAATDSGRTSLEIETARLVRIFAIFAIALCVVVAFAYAAMRGGALAGVLTGLTLAMAMLPEEFPVVLTVFLALGAWRIARHGVLTRRLPAIEMLGAATVLCCDKTGTLTENRMSLAELWHDGRWHPDAPSPPSADALREAAALACEPSPFDPMERALLRNRGRTSIFHPEEHGSGAAPKLERRYPMGEGFLAVAHGWARGAQRVAAIKGAPETVVAMCAMGEAELAPVLEAAAEAAKRGLRVLAVAWAPWERSAWPESPRDIPFRFLGLVALADPIRTQVPHAIAQCHRAGIRVVMITGDHAATARAIAAQAGIDSRRVVTGSEIEALDDARLATAMKEVNVFARVRPEQKLRLVRGLRAAGEIVAMTGDGVNDAPALKAAHIGVAMGQRGTDVAREAASLVLLDDDFTSIVGTVRLGRRIYENIRNAMRYLVAVHVPLAGMSLLPLFFGWPLFAYPVHVVFLEFVIDPACSIVFEAEHSDRGAMERPPRPPQQRLFDGPSLAVALLLGGGVLLAVALVYGANLAAGVPENGARAAAFVALVFGNLALILANRSGHLTMSQALFRRNAALWVIVAGALAATALVVYWPAAAGLFRFQPVDAGTFAVAALAGGASVLWYDLLKLSRRRQSPRGHPAA